MLSGGAAWEPALLPLLAEPGAGLHLVRRCVDVSELLAVCAAGAVGVALVDADAGRVDRDTLDRLRRLAVPVLLVVAPGTASGPSTALGLGAPQVVPRTEAPESVLARARALAGRTHPEPAPVVPAASASSTTPAQPGRLLVVWGPGGAPGRSTVAVNLATELARRGRSVLLVDADAAGGAVATMLGLVDEAPGVAAACRSALRGRLDPAVLAALAVAVDDRLRVLTGTSRPDRWRELRPAALDVLWPCARALADDVVVDVAPGLAGDEPDPLEPALVGPSAATLSALEAADEVIAVACADTLGLLRLVHGLDLLAEQVPDVHPRLVVNRVRSSVAGVPARQRVRAALREVVGREAVAFLPDDPTAMDASLRAGRALADAARSSPLRRALGDLADQLAPLPAPRVAAATSGHREHGSDRRRRSRGRASLRSGR
jgi:MinD-like ATPase involved in chromosome partitioning or flagellar assembly